MTRRTSIKLQLTGKPRLISNFIGFFRHDFSIYIPYVQTIDYCSKSQIVILLQNKNIKI